MTLRPSPFRNSAHIPSNSGLKTASNLGVLVTAANKRTRTVAQANNRSRLASFHTANLTSVVAYVLACILNVGNLYLLGFLICLLTIPMSVPAVAHDSTGVVNGFYHTSWTAKDGVPGAVLSIAQTTDGFLWIGGTGGLFRFDGLVIERYTPQDGSLLHDTVLSRLFASPDGGLWIGYNRGGASFLKNGKITNFTEQDGLPTGQTRCIAQDEDGVVWAAFVGGLARFDGTHWQKIQMDWSYPGKTA